MLYLPQGLPDEGPYHRVGRLPTPPLFPNLLFILVGYPLYYKVTTHDEVGNIPIIPTWLIISFKSAIDM